MNEPTAAGQLPQAYVENLGEPQPFTLDGRCCRFLGVPYPEIKSRALSGGSDESLLSWAHAPRHPGSANDASFAEPKTSIVKTHPESPLCSGRNRLGRVDGAKLHLTFAEVPTSFER